MGDPPNIEVVLKKDATAAELDAIIVALDKLHRRRKLMLWGYLSAAGSLVVGEVLALYIYGTAAPGRFVGWVFLLPFAVVATFMWVFGRLARQVK